MSHQPHPLLAQIPLTVSPFISLPSAPTLPYTYKPLPSTLPPSSTADQQGTEREKYVVAPSGHTAKPEEILASCQTLQSHMQKVQDDAAKTLRTWQDEIEAQNLADKRKVAPGWLDRSEKILEPKRLSTLPAGTQNAGSASRASILDEPAESSADVFPSDREQDSVGKELDTAFGTVSIQDRG